MAKNLLINLPLFGILLSPERPVSGNIDKRMEERKDHRCWAETVGDHIDDSKTISVKVNPKFIIAGKINMAGSLIDIDFVLRSSLKKIETHTEISDPGFQIENIGCGDQQLSPLFEGSKTFPDEMKRVFEMFDAIGTEDEVKGPIRKG